MTWQHPTRVAFELGLRAGPVKILVARMTEVTGLPDSVWIKAGAFTSVALLFGHNLRPPIVDLQTDEAGIVGTLSFGGVPHRVTVPWGAIPGIWADAPAVKPPEPVPPTPRAKPVLRLVP
jgi:Stringent starvation protein B